MDGVEVSERDITRVEKALKGGEDLREIFPRLKTVTTQVIETAVELRMHFTKQQGLPVRRIAADDPTDAAAVREVDLQRKFRYRRSELAERLGLKHGDAPQPLCAGAGTTCLARRRCRAAFRSGGFLSAGKAADLLYQFFVSLPPAAGSVTRARWA